MDFAILGPKKSKSVKLLCAELGVPHIWPTKRAEPVPNLLVNYGCKGRLERKLYENKPALRDILTINRRPAINKYDAVKQVEEREVRVPHTVRRYDQIPDGDYLFKPYYSQKGRGIVDVLTAENDPNIDTNNGYFQKRIRNRRYELRVTGFMWVPMEEWTVWKKLPGEGRDDDDIAWNHDQGGKFVKVNDTTQRVFREAIINAKTVLEVLDLQFGAVDFVVDAEKNAYFLEVNMRPGFSADYGADTYYSAFKKLKEMAPEDVADMIDPPIMEAAEDRWQAEPEINPLDQLEQASRKYLIQELNALMVKFTDVFNPTVIPDLEEVADHILAGTIL